MTNTSPNETQDTPYITYIETPQVVYRPERISDVLDRRMKDFLLARLQQGEDDE